MKNKKVVEKKSFSLSSESKIHIAAFALSAAMVGLPVGTVIYSFLEDNLYFTYEQSNGEYVATGTITYEKLAKCSFIQIENDILKTNEFYICRQEQYNGKPKYIDILNDKMVISLENENDARKIINEIDISNYLYGLGIKAEYTPDDVRNLLETIKENTLEESKTMVKMKINTKDIVKL